MGIKESVAEANRAFRKNGNGNDVDTEITLTNQAPPPPLTEEERSKALLQKTLRQSDPDQQVHPPEYDEFGNLPSPRVNFDRILQNKKVEVNDQKIKSAKAVLPHKKNIAAQVKEQKEKAINIELPEMAMVDHPSKEDLSGGGFTGLQSGTGPEQIPTEKGAFDSGNFLEVVRIAESNGDDSAVNAKSGATGRYQFMESTWISLMEKNPDAGLTADGRTNGDQQEIAMGLLTEENKANLENKGIPVTNGNMYVMHTLGAGRGSAVLRAAMNGDTRPASELVSDQVVKQNPTWFKNKPTSQELVDLLALKVKGSDTFTTVQKPKKPSAPHIIDKPLVEVRKPVESSGIEIPGGIAAKLHPTQEIRETPDIATKSQVGEVPSPAVPVSKIPSTEQRDIDKLPIKAKTPEKVFVPNAISPVPMIKGVDPRFSDVAAVPHTPSPVTTPDIPLPVVPKDPSAVIVPKITASPRVTTDSVIKKPIDQDPQEPVEPEVDVDNRDPGRDRQKAEAQQKIEQQRREYEESKEEREKIGAIAEQFIEDKETYIRKRTGTPTALEKLDKIGDKLEKNIPKAWEKLKKSLAETPDLLELAKIKGIDNLQEKAQRFLEYRGVTGVSGREVLNYTTKYITEFIDWIQQTERTEREKLEERTGKKFAAGAYPGSPNEKELNELKEKDNIEKVGGQGNWNAIQKDDQEGIQAGLDELTDKINGANQTKNYALVKTLTEQYVKLRKYKKVKLVQKATDTTYNRIKEPDHFKNYPLQISIDLGIGPSKGTSSAWDMMPSEDIWKVGTGMIKMESLENRTPVVSTYGTNVFEHEDGGWSVRTHDGRVLNFRDEILAKSYGDYNAANARGEHENAPPSGSAREYFNRTMAGLMMPAKLLGHAMTGPTTLIDHVTKWNKEEVFNNRSPITHEILTDFNNGTLPKTNEFYETLTRLKKSAEQNASEAGAIDKFAESYRKFFPVNQKHMAGAATAFKLLHQRKGTLHSLAFAFDNVGTFMEQGFDSIGFTLALTLGNLPVQLGMLASLAKGQSQIMIRDYIKEYGKEPSPEIMERIKISAAFSLAAEKISLGYMKGVVKGLPIVGDQVKWVNKVGAAINKSIDSNIATNLAKRLLVKPTISMFGEGVQEQFSQEAEYYGIHGKWLPPEEGTLAIVSGMTAAPTVGGTLITANIGGKIVEKVLSGESLADQRKQFQYELNRIQLQLGQISKHTRISDLDAQIENLEVEVVPHDGSEGYGVETANERFQFHYDQARLNDFSHRDALADAQRRVENELKQLKQERDELANNTPTIRVKDTIIAKAIRKQIANIDKLIAKGGNAQSIATLENQKRDLEAKLEAPVSKEELAYHQQALLTDKKIAEKLLIDSDPKASKEDKKAAKKGDPLGLKAIAALEQQLDNIAKITSVVLKPELGEPVTLAEDDPYKPEKGSGLKLRQLEGEKGEDGKEGKLVNTVELIPENPEWLDEQGRRKTEKDFPDKAAYQKFLNETKEFDANQEKGKAKLAELRKEQNKLEPDQVTAYRVSEVLKLLNEVSELDLDDDAKTAVRKIIQKFEETGILGPEAEEGKSLADKLFSGPDPFGDVQNASQEELQRLIEDPKITPETKTLLEAVKAANKIKESSRKNVHDKNIQEVGEEVVSGEEGDFKGLYTYRDDIIALYKNLDKTGVLALARKIEVQIQAMNVHAENLNKKLIAFKDAAQRNIDDPAGVDKDGNQLIWTVRGNRAVDENGKLTGSREMTYSVQQMTEAEYTQQREVEGKYLNRIDANSRTAEPKQKNGSAKLIRTLEEEVKLGKYAVDAVNAYEGSSIDKRQKLRAVGASSNRAFQAELKKIKTKIGTPIVEIPDEVIENIGTTPEQEDQKSKDKKAEKEKKKSEGKSIKDEIAEVEAKIKAVEEKIAARDAKKGDTLRSSPDEDNELEEELFRLQNQLAQLKILEEQSSEEQDESSDESLGLPDETFEDSGFTFEDAEQTDEKTEGETTEERTEPETIKGIIEDFVTSATEKYWPVIKKAGSSSLDRMLGLLNAVFSDLVQVGPTTDDLKIASLHTLKDTDFKWTQEDIDSGKYTKDNPKVGEYSAIKFYRALIDLGISVGGARTLANEYKNFKSKYNEIAYKSSFDEDNDPKNFAIRQPLSILLREYNEEGVGTLPDQVLFGMMIGAMNFRHRTPHNDRFSADWEKSLFLYGGKDTVLLDNEERELKDLGYGYNETAEQIGRDITSLLRMTAKRVAKDGKVTQHGADLYFEHFGIALGMMALEVGQHTGLFTIHRKVWNFGDGNQKGRNFNDEIKIYKGGPKKGQPIPEEKLRAYRHIKVPEGTNNKGIANYPKLQEVKRRALEELVKVTKTKMVTYGFEPLQEIAKVSTDIKRTFGNVPKKVITALKNLQKQKWNTSETLDSVVALEGHRDVLEQLMGVVPVKVYNPKTKRMESILRHKSEKDSIEAANRDKITDLEEILAAYDKNGDNNSLKDFYFKYELQNQHRILMQGRINPQQSKVTRFLLQSWGAQTYNADNLWKFKLAVAQNFGIGVDKGNLAFSEQAFEDIVHNENVQDAVRALRNIQEKKGNPKEQAKKLADALVEIKRDKDYKDSDLSLLNGITALTNYMPHGDPIRIPSEFKSDVVMEVDGVSNGFAMNVMQFPMFKNLEKILNQVGNYFDVGSFHDTTQPDVYVTLGGHVKDGANVTQNFKWYAANSWKDDFKKETYTESDHKLYASVKAGEKIEILKGTKTKPLSNDDKNKNDIAQKVLTARYKARDKALNELYPNFQNDKQLRKAVKYPFLISMYGGGIDRISKDVSKDIIKSIYEKAGVMQNLYTSMKKGDPAILEDMAKNGIHSLQEFEEGLLKAYLDSLEELGAFSDKNKTTRKAYETAIKNGKSLNVIGNVAQFDFNVSALTETLSKTLSPRLDYGLETMLGETKEPRDTVVQMGEMLHNVFMLHYRKAYDEKLAEINREYKDTLSDEELKDFLPLKKLTKPQITDLIKNTTGKLIHVFPQYEGPLSQILKNNNGEHYIEGAVDLSDMEFIQQSQKEIEEDSKLTEAEKKEKIEELKRTYGTEVVEIVYKKEDGKNGTRESFPSQLKFIEPGVAALIRQIINMDSVILTQTLNGVNRKGDPPVREGLGKGSGAIWSGDTRLLMLHDAFMGSPEQLSTISEIYGKIYLEYSLRHSIIEKTFNQLEKVMGLTKDNPAFMQELEKIYRDKQFDRRVSADKIKSVQDLIEEFETVKDAVLTARQKLAERIKEEGMVSHQMYMPKKEDTAKNADKTYSEQVKETYIDPAVKEREDQKAESGEGYILFENDKGERAWANEGQKTAINKIRKWWTEFKNQKIFVLQGRGGTGKTTIVNKALKVLEIDPLSVKFALPTHKAKQVIMEAAVDYKKHQFTTLAQLLGQVRYWDDTRNVHDFKRDDDKFRESKTKLIKSEIKLLVIDEASMVSEDFTSELEVLAKETGIRILFMGDNVQLPPIEKIKSLIKGRISLSAVFDNVMGFGQKIKLGINKKESYAELTERMRQGKESPILGITDIIANTVIDIFKRAVKEASEYDGSGKNIFFSLPNIKETGTSDGVHYMDGTREGPSETTINKFVAEYREDPAGVKYIHYNNESYPRTVNLREKIRGLLFPDRDNSDNLKALPFIETERIVLSDLIGVRDSSDNKIKSSDQLHNGDEVTVVQELYETTVGFTTAKDGKFPGKPFYDIPVKILQVRTDSKDGKPGQLYDLVMEDKSEVTIKYTDKNGETVTAKTTRTMEAINKQQTVNQRKYFPRYANKVLQEVFTSEPAAAYLINAHKAQGSTYKTVYVDYTNIMGPQGSPDWLAKLSALYVATSRPTTRLVLVGDGKLTYGLGKTELDANIKIREDLESVRPTSTESKGETPPTVKYVIGIISGVDGKRKVAAQTDHANNQILIDRPEVKKTFKEKAWTIAKMEGVTPFPADAFKTWEEWETFLIAHERVHFTEANRSLRKGPIMENHANTEAYKAIQRLRETGKTGTDSTSKKTAYSDWSKDKLNKIIDQLKKQITTAKEEGRPILSVWTKNINTLTAELNSRTPTVETEAKEQKSADQVALEKIQEKLIAGTITNEELIDNENFLRELSKKNTIEGKAVLKALEEQSPEGYDPENPGDFGMMEDFEELEPDDVSSESPEDAAVRRAKEKLEDEIDNRLKTLDDLPKHPTDKDIEELGDITKNSIKKLFNRFKKISHKHYFNKQEMEDHTETLGTVLDILNEGISAVGGIKLSLQDIHGITQGEYDIASKSMKIFLNNNAPYSNNSQSPQEVYVHELLHSTTALAIRENPLVAKRIERLYVQTEDALNAKYGEGKGYKVFLVKGIKPSKKDTDMAKRQYNYVFKGKEKAKLHEFLAYAVTNKQMIDFLKTQPKPVREGILGRLLDTVSLVINVIREAFGARTYRNTSGNAFMEMIAATEHLVAIQAKHQSLYQQYMNKTYEKMDKSDEFLKQFAEDMAVMVAPDRDKPVSTMRKGAQIVTGGLNTIFGESKGARLARHQVDKIMNKTLRGLASEIGEGTLTKAMIEQLLHVKVTISKARQQAETFIEHWFNGYPKENIKSIWKSVDPTDPHSMPVQTKIALTEIMLRTDLSTLRNKGTEFELSHKEIMELVGKDKNAENKRKAMQSAIMRKLRVHNSHKALIYAEELGYHIVTNRTKIPKAHMNAKSIAMTHFRTDNPTNEQVALLDTYATLAALKYTDSTQDTLVKKLSDKEFAKDGNQNGIIDLIDYHLDYKKNAREDLFSYPAEGGRKYTDVQMVKGYIVERVDNFTHVKVGTKADIPKMKREGYTEHYDLTKVDESQTYDTLFVTRTIPEVPDISGVMSTTNQRNMGTTLTEILVRDPAFHHKAGPNKGQPDFYKIKVKVKQFIAKQEKAAKNVKWDHNLKLRPVFDENNNITDYRVLMDNDWKKEILQPDLEIDHVFAHMQSSMIDRKETIESDKKTVELLVYEQMEMMPDHPDMNWVDIMDPDSPYIDRYRKLPHAVREHIKSYALNGQFKVREDIIDKVFGYKAFDLSQLKLLQAEGSELYKRAAGVTHHAIKQTISYGKNRVVIAMPQVVVGNMMSNIYQLLMRKIPITYIFHKIYEGISEYNKYDKDTKKRTKLNAEIRAKGLDPKTSEQALEVARLNDRIEGNLLHRMNKAGLHSLIVEDINDAQTDGWINKLKKTIPGNFPAMQKYIDNVPPYVGDIAAFLFMTKSSKPYQISRHIVQLTDLLGRYVMIEHGTKVQGRGFNEVMHEALDAFVLFDEALIPALEAVDAVGATSFLSYYLRNARASKQLVQTSPTGVAMSAIFQHATGIPTLGNVNSSWLGGKFSPNYLQADDLFDEANNVTLVDIVMNEGRNLFD